MATDDLTLGASVSDWRPPSCPERAVMKGRHVRLEPLSPAHADKLHLAFASAPDIWRYISHGPYMDGESFGRWVGSVADGKDPLFYALIPASTGRPAGVASYMRIAPAAGSIEVGHIVFSPILQGTVAATEAMMLMMAGAFEAGYRRYEWKCNALNLPSRRAAERLGFSYEGVFRQAEVVKGRNRDTAWFAAIDKEWPALKSAFDTWLDPANFDAEGRQLHRLSDLTRPVLVARDPVLSSVAP